MREVVDLNMTDTRTVSIGACIVPGRILRSLTLSLDWRGGWNIASNNTENDESIERSVLKSSAYV